MLNPNQALAIASNVFSILNFNMCKTSSPFGVIDFDWFIKSLFELFNNGIDNIRKIIIPFPNTFVHFYYIERDYITFKLHSE